MTNTIIYFMKSILIPLFIIFVVPSIALAQEKHKGFCQKAETTVDLIDCIGTHYKSEVSHMNDLYQKLLTATPDNHQFTKNLKDNQSQWIAYRDSICNIEGSIYEGGSLERVQQMDCMTRVTSDRAAHFTKMATAINVNEIPVFTAPPRWKNVLINNYPNIFWRMGETQSFDADCDGDYEKIIEGLQKNIENNTLQTVFAVAETPITGRPSATLLTIDWDQSCTGESFIASPSTELENCTMQIKTNNQKCNIYELSFDKDSKSYSIFNSANKNNEKTTQ